MRKLLVVLPLLSLMGAQCGSSGNCTVTKDAASGVATITCPDGTSVDVAPGAKGDTGTAGVAGEKGNDGAAGKDGKDGANGASGTNGTNCTVTRSADAGVTTIACADGTTATVQDGEDGAQGPVGPQGPAGDAGMPGSNGTSCTVTRDSTAGTTTIACSDGTTAVVSDGQSGAQGPQGPQGPAGSQGDAGQNGTSCTVTKDADAGVTTIACADGTTATVLDGAQALVRLEEELAGPNCSQGGTRVLTGLDTSRNGVLELGEVTQTRYVCGTGSSTGCTRLEGSYIVTNTLDWQNLARSGCTELTGDLVIAAPGLVTLTPPVVLTSLGGNLRGGENAFLANLPLPELTSVAGYIDLSLNPALTAFTLPKLQNVAGKALPGCRAAFPYRDDGTGTCVLMGCAIGYRDGGDGQCVANGTCSPGFQEQAGWCRGELVSVAGGSANGSDWGYAGGSVTVASFQLDRTEVTVAQYGACVTAGGCTVPAVGWSCNWQVTGKELHPINCVDWNQAAAFCAWAGKRLPTEVEWQWAASNGGSTVYPWSDAVPHSARAKYLSMDGTVPVATRPAGASQTGIQDLAGNVWEWTSSDDTPPYKVYRGGSWNYSEDKLRASDRNGATLPSEQGSLLGFRCAH